MSLPPARVASLTTESGIAVNALCGGGLDVYLLLPMALAVTHGLVTAGGPLLPYAAKPVAAMAILISGAPRWGPWAASRRRSSAVRCGEFSLSCTVFAGSLWLLTY